MKRILQNRKKTHKNYTGKVMLLLTLCAFLVGCAGKPETEAFQLMDTAMGTVVNLKIYTMEAPGSGSGKKEAAGQENPGQKVAGELLDHMDVMEKERLSWRLEGSQVWEINHSAGTGKALQLSEEMRELLDSCHQVWEASGGAFDIALGKVARLWDIDTWAVDPEGFVLPEEEDVARARENSGMDLVRLENGSIQLDGEVQLDFGAVGKGIALDELRGILEQQEEVTGAVLSLGGSILTYGEKPDGSSWNVSIVDPFDTSGNLGILQLRGINCVSTSGDYERFVEFAGEKYHHILDPATGRPADSGLKSVTILSESGFLSDALSTACFVLGVDKGMELAEEFHAEALFVDETGEIFMTSEMEAYFRPM